MNASLAPASGGSRSALRLQAGLLLSASLLVACDEQVAPSRGLGPWASEVVAFSPGPGAGFGAEELPDVVVGPPDGHGRLQGSLDVLSLGAGGVIVLGFSGRELVDGPGPDLVIFENPFWAGGDASAVWAEPGEVALSDDGEAWHVFACDSGGDGDGHWPGCAGVTPTESFDGEAGGALDPDVCGGDAFDLADLGLASARFVRITDVSNTAGAAPAAPSAGFDLDAVGAVHIRDREW